MAHRDGDSTRLATHFLQELAMQEGYPWLSVMDGGPHTLVILDNPREIGTDPRPVCECPKRLGPEHRTQLRITLRSHARQR